MVPVVHELPEDPAVLPGLYVRSLQERPWLDETRVAITSQWRSSDQVPPVYCAMCSCLCGRACSDVLASLTQCLHCNALPDTPA